MRKESNRVRVLAAVTLCVSLSSLTAAHGTEWPVTEGKRVMSANRYRMILAQNESQEGKTVTSEELIKFYAPKEVKTRGLKSRGISGVKPGVYEARRGFRNILFDFNSHTITGSSYRQLDEIGLALQTVMKQYRDVTFTIEGHTDNVGSESYNRVLSRQRAEAVRDYLVHRFSLEGARVIATGYGEERPIASNDSELGRDQNRRVEIVRK